MVVGVLAGFGLGFFIYLIGLDHRSILISRMQTKNFVPEFLTALVVLSCLILIPAFAIGRLVEPHALAGASDST